MGVLVTFALPAEFAPWRAQRGFRRRPCRAREEPLPHGGYHLYEAQVGEYPVNVILTGIGCRGERFALQHALQTDCDLCVSAGLAGGLRDGLKIGEVVATRRAIARGTEAQAPSSPSLISAAAACGAKILDASLTSDELAVTARQKEALAAKGDIVEMESYHVLRAAAAAKVPAVVVRAISDTVHEDLPLNFELLMDTNGEVSMPRLLGSVARQPAKIPALARFGRQSRRSAENLAAFLDRFIEHLHPDLGNAKSMALRVAGR